ncbi:hypothetical protein BDK51DRAFT_49206 [Blyttiomyces helicus]|uniref:Xrn1 N-terminal domain-containing protein n=1 Tax=Blyttiomyces helicus TaxID=388810 RepID=A0A4P9VXT9_9FUNG|nr:hypothetical protein BDK51DRAFT_49206 [Blyttiomyces helicus]|eukprot:RKO83108.1 hypothetical protein BDK51DRAFT_49206 [Blyttiomyces helicus]
MSTNKLRAARRERVLGWGVVVDDAGSGPNATLWGSLKKPCWGRPKMSRSPLYALPAFSMTPTRPMVARILPRQLPPQAKTTRAVKLALTRDVDAKEVIRMAIDGPAPIAKLELQRKRREKHMIKEKKFDSRKLTPGTLFVERNTLRSDVWNSMLPVTPAMPDRSVILDGSNVPGEDEAKLFQHILNAQRPESGKPTTHAIIGVDNGILVQGDNSPPRQPFRKQSFITRPHFIKSSSGEAIASLSKGLFYDDQCRLEVLYGYCQALTHRLPDRSGRQKDQPPFFARNLDQRRLGRKQQKAAESSVTLPARVSQVESLGDDDIEDGEVSDADEGFGDDKEVLDVPMTASEGDVNSKCYLDSILWCLVSRPIFQFYKALPRFRFFSRYPLNHLFNSRRPPLARMQDMYVQGNCDDYFHFYAAPPPTMSDLIDFIDKAIANPSGPAFWSPSMLSSAAHSF